VRFLGFQDDVTPILRQVDVFVQPGQGEQFGLAALEACAEGAVPILFDDGLGGPSAIPPGGAVVRGVKELADVLDAMISSPALTEDARNERRLWTRERFSIRRTAREYLELYESAAAKTRP
jgi:glycosyltransferase involved in cell wall biosynthesis